MKNHLQTDLEVYLKLLAERDRINDMVEIEARHWNIIPTDGVFLVMRALEDPGDSPPAMVMAEVRHQAPSPSAANAWLIGYLKTFLDDCAGAARARMAGSLQ